MNVSILGTEYKIELSTKEQDPKLHDCNGYCDFSIKKCVIEKLDEQDICTLGDADVFKRKVMRHEIIHAFLAESGLRENSEWGCYEEAVDWIAMQFPKMQKAFIECGCAE